MGGQGPGEQRPQGSQCHALGRDARSVATMVEGAPIARRCRNACGGTLAVSRQEPRQADDDPPTQPAVPPGGGCSRDQEGDDAAPPCTTTLRPTCWNAAPISESSNARMVEIIKDLPGRQEAGRTCVECEAP